MSTEDPDFNLADANAAITTALNTMRSVKTSLSSYLPALQERQYSLVISNLETIEQNLVRAQSQLARGRDLNKRRWLRARDEVDELRTRLRRLGFQV